MFIAIKNGMTVQSDSSLIEPAIGRGISNGRRRRNLTTKKMSATEINVVKKIVRPTKEKKSASTCPAKVDPESGNGIHDCIRLSSSSLIQVRRSSRRLAARRPSSHQKNKQCDHRRHRQHPGPPVEIYHPGVFARRGVVVIAVEQQLIDGRADLARSEERR